MKRILTKRNVLLFICFLLITAAIGVGTITAGAAGDLSAPVISLNPTKKGFILRMEKASAGAGGYEIQYSTDKNFKSAKTVQMDSSLSEKLVTGLSAAKTYYVRARAYQNTSKGKMYGAYCAKQITITPVSGVTQYKTGFFYESIPKSVKSRIIGKSYRSNPYIGLSNLRYVRVLYYDFSGKIKGGELIVNKKIASKIVKIFYELYQIRYPIQKMVLVDEYGASDDRSMAANNTSAFNYRKIAGSTSLSKHAYGLAIDINPMINPYVKNGSVSPSNGKTYAQRTVSKCNGIYRDKMIHKNDKIYKIFKKYGFKWGGDWKSVKDYQHFEY